MPGITPPSHLEIVLTQLQCLKQQEKDGDEMYVVAELSHLDGQKIGKERLPHEFGFWNLKQGEAVSPDRLIYIGDLARGLRVEVTLMEMDMVRLSQGSVGIVGTWVDDFIGRFVVLVHPDGRVETQDGKHAQRQGQGHVWRLTGNKAEYLLHLDVRIQ